MTIPTNKENFSIYWPNDLNIIKVTEEEKKIINYNITKLRSILSQRNANLDPQLIQYKNSICPRTLCIVCDHSFVLLNSHGGMPKFDSFGTQQKKIKYVWDCQTGSFWLKKSLLSLKQADCLNFLKYFPDVGLSSLGLPNILFWNQNRHKKIRYFEEMASSTLPIYLKTSKPSFNLTYIVGLMDALRKIHTTKYQPATFSVPNFGPASYGYSHTLFHGDISPNNIICVQVKENDKFIAKLMLTDFYGIGNLENFIHTRGWLSPEGVQYTITRTKYQEMRTPEFLSKYGTKKDTWAMGLLIGSILRGGLNLNTKQPLPFFSFITKKLKYSSDGFIVDESGIAQLRQEEIDFKINTLIEHQPSEKLKTIWRCVKRYLTIDPDARPTMEECFVSYPGIELCSK